MSLFKDGFYRFWHLYLIQVLTYFLITDILKNKQYLNR